ncbi:uncharacterized protein LOC143034490 [Oratosquilla oratoria]|uniref:uncharacterized protein LOC143034490 n=1 Tax=Oratosquilla oratoria TaxID=337810 RepID=UPI003F77446D
MSYFHSYLTSSMLSSSMLLLAVVTMATTSTSSASPVGEEQLCLPEAEVPRVWPTIRPITVYKTKNSDFRMVDINWVVSSVEEDDWVGVFEKDPRSNSLAKLLFSDVPSDPSGVVTSNVTHERPQVSQFIRSGCVGVWVAYMRNDTPIASDCIRAHPEWMWENRKVLGDKTLRELVLPGVHNAGAYTTGNTMDAVQAWVVCQDEPVLTQLLYGNRYLDLRVGFYPNSSELLWVNHDLVQWLPLTEVLKDIRAFTALSPDPVVVDFHRFPVGFDQPEAHPLLVSLLHSSLGTFMLPSSEGPSPTLNRIWETGLQLIVGYADKDIVQNEPNLWPAVPHAWADTVIVQELEDFLDDQMKRRQASSRIWAAMVELTPTIWDILMKSSTGLRGFATVTNQLVTSWMEQKWADLASIITLDFFLGSDFINTAIRINLHRATCLRSPRLLNDSATSAFDLEHYPTLGMDLDEFGVEGSGDECDEVSLFSQDLNETDKESASMPTPEDVDNNSSSLLSSDNVTGESVNQDQGSRMAKNLSDAESSVDPTAGQESNSMSAESQNEFENRLASAPMTRLFTTVRVSNSTDASDASKNFNKESEPSSQKEDPREDNIDPQDVSGDQDNAPVAQAPGRKAISSCRHGVKRQKNSSSKRTETTLREDVDEEEMSGTGQTIGDHVFTTTSPLEYLEASQEGLFPHITRHGDEAAVRRKREAQNEKRDILRKMLGRKKLLQILAMSSGTSKESGERDALDGISLESSQRNIPSVLSRSADFISTLRLLQRRSILFPRLVFS